MSLDTNALRKLLHTNEHPHQEVIARCRGGDRQAFNQFILAYQDRIFSYMRQMTGNDQAATTLTRDVFVAAYKALPHLAGDVAIDVWLFKLAEQRLQRPWRKRIKRYWRRLVHMIPSVQPESPESQDRQELLLPYLDGELRDPEVQQVEQWLAEDAAYREESEQIQQTDHPLRFFSQTFAPVELRVAINARLDAPSLWARMRAAIAVLRGSISGSGLSDLSAEPMPLPTRGAEGDGDLSPYKQPLLETDPCKEIRRQAEAQYAKAELYQKHAQHAKAIHLFLTALTNYQQIEDREGQLAAHYQLALLYKETGERAEALTHVQEFLRLYHDLQIVTQYTQMQELLKGLQ